MNFIGVVAALTAFLAIWIGHAAVRRIESRARVLWIPGAMLLAAGLLLEWAALRTSSLELSAALGITGITLMWDAVELARQERRVRAGHAPANPDNPRHAALLARPGSHATTLNLLKSEPAAVMNREGTGLAAEERGFPY